MAVAFGLVATWLKRDVEQAAAPPKDTKALSDEELRSAIPLLPTKMPFLQKTYAEIESASEVCRRITSVNRRVRISVQHQGKTRFASYGTRFAGSAVVTTRHTFKELFPLTVKVEYDGAGLNGEFWLKLEEDDVVSPIGHVKDVCMFNVPGLLPVERAKIGTVPHKVRFAHSTAPATTAWTELVGSFAGPVTAFMTRGAAVVGDCGTPWFDESGDLVGIHALAKTEDPCQIGCYPLYAAGLEDAYRKICSRKGRSTIALSAFLQDHPNILPSHNSHPARWKSNCIAIGSEKRSASMKTNLVLDEVLGPAIQFASKGYAPAIDRGLVDGRPITTAEHVVRATNLWPHAPDERVLEGVLDSMLADLEPLQARVSPLTKHETLFGRAGSEFVKRVEMSTSAGPVLRQKYGWKKKSDFIEGDVVDPRFWAEYDSVHARVKDWNHTATYEGIPKDEILASEKVDQGKARLIYVTCAAYNCVVRAYLLPLLEVLMYDRGALGIAIGANVFGPDWSAAACHLDLENQDKADEVDGKSYDLRYIAQVKRIVRLFFLAIARKFGYDEDDRAMVDALFNSFEYAIVFIKGNWYVFHFLFPSGIPVTAFVNTIRTIIVHRYCFYRFLLDRGLKFTSLIFQTSPSLFSRKVRGLYFGDDLGSTNSMVVGIERFGQSHLVLYGRELGVEFQPAKKGNEMADFTDPKDLTFLKRRFVLCPARGWIAPLELDSIFKMLAYRSTKSGLAPSEWRDTVVDTALYELSLHSREVFEKYTSFFAERGYDVCSYDAYVVEHQLGLRRPSWDIM